MFNVYWVEPSLNYTLNWVQIEGSKFGFSSFLSGFGPFPAKHVQGSDFLEEFEILSNFGECQV